ncbi:MAG: hypothetical protein AAFV19_14760 [Pseudomonadota bacterium]
MRSLLAAAMIAMAGQAAAECFTRTYSDAHLATTPNQTVRSISVLFGPHGDPAQAKASVVFRDSAELWKIGVYCSAGGLPYDPDAPRWCGVECDGGTFTVRERGADTILLTTGRGFDVGTACAETDTEETRRVADRGAATTVFRLDRADRSACR